jgi:hypothetical protein
MKSMPLAEYLLTSARVHLPHGSGHLFFAHEQENHPEILLIKHQLPEKRIRSVFKQRVIAADDPVSTSSPIKDADHV